MDKQRGSTHVSDVAAQQADEAARPTTLGELRASGYRPKTIREEMRDNLIARMRRGDELFPGIIGYEETVIPQIENAILSGQDIIFLGERGQAKTRMARSLVNLLDEAMPIVAGSRDQRRPVPARSRSHARDLVAEQGDETPIDWVGRERRYGEKLATPDMTIADLIGEVDPIKVAEGRYLSDELTIHYGLIPRTNRGIFVINELPDLAERIQVGLLNIMEERDVQIRGYKIRLPLDVFVVASRQPRGLHQPRPHHHAAQGPLRLADPHPLPANRSSTRSTSWSRSAPIFDDGRYRGHGAGLHEGDRGRADASGPRARTNLPALRRLGAHERRQLREHASPTRMRRAIRLGERQAAPRITDLAALVASTTGQDRAGDAGRGPRGAGRRQADAERRAGNVFNRYFSVREFDDWSWPSKMV